jgi:hypothetical protein
VKKNLWSPSDCIRRHHAAILVPYLNRKLHMHTLITRHVANITFIRGMLLNVGFIESNKDNHIKWKCHAYHDVDMISENDRTL